MATKHESDKSILKEGPSPYGSHAVMVNEEESDQLVDKKFVVLKDEQGLYLTERCNLDTRLADPYRNTDIETRNKVFKAAQRG